MNRRGTVLIPLTVGFLLTVAIVSWHSGWWQQHDALVSPSAVQPSIETRRSALRVVQVDVSAAPSPTATAPAAPAPATPEVQPQPVSAPLAPPPPPRVDPGNSPELLEAPDRKFARGSTGGD